MLLFAAVLSQTAKRYTETISRLGRALPLEFRHFRPIANRPQNAILPHNLAFLDVGQIGKLRCVVNLPVRQASES
jgi:hypothetical protein